jgi:hypothetical protein
MSEWIDNEAISEPKRDKVWKSLQEISKRIDDSFTTIF